MVKRSFSLEVNISINEPTRDKGHHFQW